MDEECGICFETMTITVPLACCGQRVCKNCFINIIAVNPRCPYCAAQLPIPRATTQPENPIDMLVCASAVLALFCCVITTGVVAGLPIH